MVRSRRMEKKIELSKGEQRVFDFMLSNGGITSKECFEKLGDTRLSARIYSLQKKGVTISAKWEHKKNRYKEMCYYKRYYVG